MTSETFGDVADLFEFDEEHLDYYDGPLRGWLRRKRDGAWFAYDCQLIIDETLWHWTLVAVASKEGEPADALVSAKRQGAAWISLVEDRRLDEAIQCRMMPMPAGHAMPLQNLPSGKAQPTDDGAPWTPDEVLLTILARNRIRDGLARADVVASLARELNRRESTVDAAIRAAEVGLKASRVLRALLAELDDADDEIERIAASIRQRRERRQ
jgi:hypothetical protein